MASATEQLARQFNWGTFGKAKDLKARILFTLGALIILRLGAHIPLPGVDPEAFAASYAQKSSGILGMLNLFSGGAVQRMAIFALGIVPYISSSLIVMFLGFGVPFFEQLRNEGEAGQRKINQYTRYLTVLISIIQGYAAAIGLEHMGSGSHSVVISAGWFFRLTTVVTLVGGTIFLMWLGEQITARGIGNGSSIFMFAGIVAGLPRVIYQTLELGRQGAISSFVIFFIAVLCIATIAFIVWMERAQRRVPVQYPKRQVGQKIFGGESTHMPIKVNPSGLLAPICASSLMLLPATIIGFTSNNTTGWMAEVARYMQPGHLAYMTLYAVLIIFFCFFITPIVFNVKQHAENLRKSNGFIPGIKPGKNTADYLSYILNRITVVGAAYITAVCLLPTILASNFNVPFALGGTALLIAVTTPMDVVAQIHSHLVQHQYEGLMRKTRQREARRK